jgi:hypothetical protein
MSKVTEWLSQLEHHKSTASFQGGGSFLDNKSNNDVFQMVIPVNLIWVQNLMTLMNVLLGPRFI